MVLVGASLADRRAEHAEPRDILDLPWLQELGTSEMSNWLRDRGVIAPHKENITHLPGHLVLEALRNGDGVSLTARALIEREIAAGQLMVLFEDSSPASATTSSPAPACSARRSRPSSPGSAAMPAHTPPPSPARAPLQPRGRPAAPDRPRRRPRTWPARVNGRR